MINTAKTRELDAPDLSPFEIDRIDLAGSVLVIDPPLILTPISDAENAGLLTVEDGEFNLCVGAETRGALEDEVRQHLAFMWREYALEDPEKLTADAQQLRTALRTRMREDHAA